MLALMDSADLEQQIRDELFHEWQLPLDREVRWPRVAAKLELLDDFMKLVRRKASG